MLVVDDVGHLGDQRPNGHDWGAVGHLETPPEGGPVFGPAQPTLQPGHILPHPAAGQETLEDRTPGR